MRFLIAFDLPIRNNPEREFEKHSLRAGRTHARRMEMTLRMFLKSDHPIDFFLFVWNGEAWVPSYLVVENPEGFFTGGWGRGGRSCGCVFNYDLKD